MTGKDRLSKEDSSSTRKYNLPWSEITLEVRHTVTVIFVMVWINFWAYSLELNISRKLVLEPRSVKLRVTTCKHLLNDMTIIQSLVLQVTASQSAVLLFFSTLHFSFVDEMLTKLERPSQMLEGCYSDITALNRKSVNVSMSKYGLFSF